MNTLKNYSEFILEFNDLSKNDSFDDVKMEKKGRSWYIRKGGELIKIPSVTTIIGHFQDISFIDEWKKRVGEDVVKRETEHAKNRGTVMHRLLDVYFEKTKDLNEIEEYCKNQWPKMPEEDWRCGYDLFCNLVKAGICDKVKKTEEVEYPIGALDNGGYWGLIDFVATFTNNEKVIVDFKSAKAKRNNDTIEKYKSQLAAYLHAWEFMKGERLNRAELWISYEDNPDGPEVIELTGEEIEKYEKIFLDEVKEFHLYSDYKMKRSDFEKFLSPEDIQSVLVAHGFDGNATTPDEAYEILKNADSQKKHISEIMTSEEMEEFKRKYNIDAEIVKVLKGHIIKSLEK